VYRCPRTGQMVQGWIADEPMGGEAYEPVTCTACGRVHLINPKTGKIFRIYQRIEASPRARDHTHRA
jgi:hypothetical protein